MHTKHKPSFVGNRGSVYRHAEGNNEGLNDDVTGSISAFFPETKKSKKAPLNGKPRFDVKKHLTFVSCIPLAYPSIT